MTEQHLTQPHSERIQALRQQTATGQAHWAGTGPEGTRCISCEHARFSGYYSARGKRGNLKPIYCGRYASMMEDKPKFDANQPSCRYYEVGSGPPKKA